MRKSVEITIDVEGRDKGKRFLITEMDAFRTEAWARRALGAMARSGVAMPANAMAGTMGTMAILGVQALLAAPHSETEPLFTEMMESVQSVQPAATRPLNAADDIEEIATIVRLRDEVFKLHVGFSPASEIMGAFLLASQTATESILNTPTSPEPSARSSRRARRPSPKHKPSTP